MLDSSKFMAVGLPLLTSKEKERTMFINDTRPVTADGISGWPYSSWSLIQCPMFD